MNLALTLALAAGAVALAALALVARHRASGAALLACMGVLVAALLLSLGYAGLAVAALAATLGTAAAGLVAGRGLSEVETQEVLESPRGPWLLASVASALLALAVGVGLLVVDWPAASLTALGAAGGAAGDSRAGAAALPDGTSALLEWSLAALGAATALALAAFAPRRGEE
jgi:hypothetical protein